MTRYLHSRCLLSLALLLEPMGLSHTVAMAGILVGPATATVNNGDTADFWTLSNSASLTVNPGATTLQISAANSAISLNNASVSATGNAAVQVTGAGSTTSIIGSTLANTTGTGFSVGLGAIASISDSTVSAVGRGLNVAANSQLNASNVQVTANSNGSSNFLGGGNGLTIIGGTATISAGSTLTGADHGALISSDTAGTGAAGRVAALTVDASQLTGQAGSALIIGTAIASRPSISTVEVRNGSTLTGGNGLAVEVQSQSEATVNVAGSTLNGGISVLGASTLTASLQGSNLTGNTQVGQQSNLHLDAQGSSLSGNIDLLDTSTAVLAFRAGTALNGSIVAASGTSANVSLDGSTLTGDITATGASADLIMGNASVLNGQLNDVSQLTLSSGSVWNMSQSSRVDNLVIDASQINLNGSSDAFHTLTLGTLTGTGTFALNTDIAAHAGDQIVVTGEASGNHTLLVASSGADPVAGDTGLVLVNTAGVGSATFALATGKVDAGTYVYTLAHEGNNWALVQATTGGEPEEPTEPGEPGQPEEPGEPGEPIVSPSARAVLGLFNAAPTVWYGELATLRSRMGELRLGNGAGGPWIRTYGSQSNMSAGGGVAYQQNQHGITFGIDTPLPAADGQWLVGIMGGYSRSDLDLSAGTNGQVDSYYVGLYSTWLTSSGYYLDAVIKANRLRNSSDVVMSDGQRASGDYDSHGIGGSVEAGKHIDLGQGWFVEPYLQGSALWVSGDDYHLDNGMDASSNHANSLLGKVGTHIGRTFTLADGGAVQPYLKVAAAHEFANSNRVNINDNSFTNDLSGSRAELGAGVISQLTKALQLHADFDYSNGNNIEQPWAASVGVRYAW